MYFYGRFREKPRLHYTGTHKAIFKDRIENQLSIVSLCRMFKKVDEGATRITFWFCVPDVDLEGGLHPIRDNNDIELMNQCYWNLPKERLIYACSGDEPFEKEPEDGGVSDGIKNEGHDTGACEDGGVTNTTGTAACEDDEEPEWLKDGLETIEDEDIFSPKKDAVGDSNYNKKGGAGADGTSASSKLPVHVFSFAGKSDEKSSPKRGSVRKKRASKNSQYRGPDVIQQITPPVSEQRPSEVEDVSIEKGPVSSQKLSKDESINIEKPPATFRESNLREEDERVGNAEVTEEDWQEPVVPDEELLDKFRSGSGEEDDCLDFNPEVEFRKPHFELKVGQKFTNFRVFRSVLCEWLVREGYEVTWVKNYSKKIRANCAKGCSRRIRATPIQDESAFQIKSLKGEHVCAREYQNKHATATYLSSKYQDKIRDNPKIELMGLKNDIRRDLMINVSIAKVGRAKRKAKDMMLGTDMEQYQKLWSYAATVRDTNAGSTIKIQIDKAPDGSTGIFQRLYYCLHACKQGFLDGCRPIIGLDGCFLKTAFGGQLLSALGRDGNDNMVPIAIAVVEVERYDSWK
ncbi:uncharacterized protein [Coffea arabica]|uniref:Transposase MuDR plant domain-containing protein n=1 Tax=Coffea arabica TaxID=13443 RepID=A0A6P6V9Y8_COFAR